MSASAMTDQNIPPDRNSDPVDRLDDESWAAALRLVLDTPGDGRPAARAWSGADVARQALLRDLETVTQVVRSESGPVPDAAWARLRSELTEGAAVQTSTPSRTPTARRRSVTQANASRRWLVRGGIAGGLAAAAMLAAAGIRRMTAPEIPGVGAIYTTKTGQHATITLADGSTITLAPQSRVSVAKQFGTSTRTVSLEGEAYFTVTATADAPFVVQAGNVTTRVLGTTFDVRHYPTDSAVRIAVITGKVVSGTNHKSVTLVAGTVGHVTDSTATSAIQKDLAAYTAWTQGQLVFDNAAVPAMLSSLGRWYGYEFRLADAALAQARISAVFRTDAPSEAMDVLKEMLDVTMTMDGRVVTLRHRNARASNASRNRSQKISSTHMEVGR